MAKAGFYAVAKGRVPGIYASWQDCETQVKGYTGARYKKFRSQREAEDFIATNNSAITALVPSAGGSRLLPVPASTSRSMAQPQSLLQKSDVSRKGNGVDEEGFDVVYADGACKGNGQAGSVAGVGVWWGHNDSRNIAERCPGAQTNNRAELIAIVRVLETTPFIRPLIIKTDSTYSIKCLQEWHQNWALRNWKTASGKPVLNAQVIKYLLSLLTLRHLQGVPVKFVYVKGHAGIEGNEGADAQANLGAGMLEVPERDWEDERRRVEELVEEVTECYLEGLGPRPGPELVDKAVQVEIANSDEVPDMPMEDLAEADVQATNGHAPNGSVSASASTSTSSSSTSTSTSTPVCSASKPKSDVQVANGQASNGNSSTSSPACPASTDSVEVPIVGAPAPPNPGQANADTQKLNSDDSLSPTIPESESKSKGKGKAAQNSEAPQAHPNHDGDNLTIINVDEFGPEDLLSPEELEAELAAEAEAEAESQKEKEKS